MSVNIIITISGTELITVVQVAAVSIWLKNKLRIQTVVEPTADASAVRTIQRGARKKK